MVLAFHEVPVRQTLPKIDGPAFDGRETPARRLAAPASNQATARGTCCRCSDIQISDVQISDVQISDIQIMD